MTLQMMGLTCDMLGTVLIAYTALRVHDRVLKEHKIDGAVVKAMQTEKMLGVLGVSLVIIGYVLQLTSLI